MLYLLSTSCVLTLASSLLFPLGYVTAAQFLPIQGSSSSATRTTSCSRCSSPSRRPCGDLLSFGELLSYLYFASAVSDIFVIYIIDTSVFALLCLIRDMIARFMSFYKPGITVTQDAIFCDFVCVFFVFSSYSGLVLLKS